jgi:hypothetical protein
MRHFHSKFVGLGGVDIESKHTLEGEQFRNRT